jgi:pimeloyl-ACP methyl ester carboxylesterase
MVTNEADEQIELKIQGKSIPVWIYGSDKKLTIFLIHGYPNPFSSFKGDLPMKYLQNNYRVVAFDLPGFGKSRVVRMDSDTFIQMLIKQLQIQTRIVLFGLSYGGIVSLKFAHNHPEQVAGVIVGGTLFPHRFIQMLSGISSRPISLVNNRLSLVMQAISTLSPKYLQEIQLPVLLLYSWKDTVGKATMGKKIHRHLKNASIEIIHDRTHGWLMHRIDQTGFLKAIEQFLREIKR